MIEILDMLTLAGAIILGGWILMATYRVRP
jgi:hypothetical protein